MSRYYFLFRDTGRSWQISDPVAWCLDHAGTPLLAPAADRLLESPDEPDRLIRVVLRRCGLVLVSITASNILVSYWGEPAPDVRAFAKDHRLGKVRSPGFIFQREERPHHGTSTRLRCSAIWRGGDG